MQTQPQDGNHDIYAGQQQIILKMFELHDCLLSQHLDLFARIEQLEQQQQQDEMPPVPKKKKQKKNSKNSAASLRRKARPKDYGIKQ